MRLACLQGRDVLSMRTYIEPFCATDCLWSSSTLQHPAMISPQPHNLGNHCCTKYTVLVQVQSILHSLFESSCCQIRILVIENLAWSKNLLNCLLNRQFSWTKVVNQTIQNNIKSLTAYGSYMQCSVTVLADDLRVRSMFQKCVHNGNIPFATCFMQRSLLPLVN